MIRWLLVTCLAAAACRPAAESPQTTPSSAPASSPRRQPASAPKPPTPLPPAASGAPLGENRSGIDYVGECLGTRPCRCRAPELFHGRNALGRLGIDEVARTEGSSCLLGDLDGNGHTDAVFLGAPKSGLRPAIALMFDEVGLSAVLDLPKPVRSLALGASIPGRATLEDGAIVFLVRDGKFVVGTKPEATPAPEPE